MQLLSRQNCARQYRRGDSTRQQSSSQCRRCELRAHRQSSSRPSWRYAAGAAALADLLFPKHRERVSRMEQDGAVPLPAELAGTQLPRHLAVIMDGNFRWATQRALDRNAGHEAGLEAFKSLLRCCRSWGVEALTVFAFSAENWSREAGEVSFLMDLLTRALEGQASELAARDIRLTVIGDHAQLPQQLKDRIANVEASTAGNKSMQLTIALSYGARQDITAAARHLASLAAQGLLDPQQIDESVFEAQLSSGAVLQGVGAPDLLIRTSGEMRLSNFMLWELAYAELYFADVFWPDFDEQQLVKALQAYSKRQRRFGKRT